MRFSVLSSGSKANSVFVEAGGARFLVDCGLSGKQATERLAEIGVCPSTLSAIIVTHEHSDHINGVGTLSRRYNLPVYANRATMESISKPRAKEVFKTGEDFYIRDTRIEPFSVVHDAADPVGFAMYAGGLKLVICTDLGRVTTLVREHLKDANAVVLESNHDLEMLQSCDYTWELKQRIASTHGHLSNESAGELIEEIMHPELFHIVLGHLSENSNTPTLALDTAKRFISQCQDRACGLQTLLCGNIYSTLPCLELDVSSAPRVLMSA